MYTKELVLWSSDCLVGALVLLIGFSSGFLRAEPFIRGDVNDDGVVDGADGRATVGVVFDGDTPGVCGDTLDANDDGELDIADAVKVFLFVGRGVTSPLPPPGMACVESGDQNFICEDSFVYQPGYDLTPDDPFSCGDTVVVGEGADRPVAVHVPPSYDPEVPIPLVLQFHGTVSVNCALGQRLPMDIGSWTENYRNYRALADSRGFLYAHPNAKFVPISPTACTPIWIATFANSWFVPEPVDDSAYLRGVIDEIKQNFPNVDPKRVYVIGRSAGGFMAHRMACDHSDAIAAIVSIAGATYGNPELSCTASNPVHVLQIHGTEDAIHPFEGGSISGGPRYPGAVETVEIWATLNGCSLVSEAGPSLDFEVAIDGVGGDPAETLVTRYRTGCDAGGSSELWTVSGGDHAPAVLTPPGVEPRVGNPAFSEAVIDWLLAHPKP